MDQETKKTELTMKTNTMKKKERIRVVGFVLFMVFFVLVKTFTKDYLLSKHVNGYNAHMLVGTMFNLVLSLVSIAFVRRFSLQKLGGLSDVTLNKPKLLVFPLLFLPILNVLFMDEIPDFPLINLCLLTLYCVSIGFAEELSIRSVLLPLLVRREQDSEKGVFKAVLLSSLFFGLLHLIHFNKGIYGEFAQVFFATFIGFMFGALLIVVKRVCPLIIIHAVIDFFAKIDGLGKEVKPMVYDPMDLFSSVFSVLLTLPCFVYGYVILKRYFNAKKAV